MKNKLILALVVLALVFGMVLTACDDGGALKISEDQANGKYIDDKGYLGSFGTAGDTKDYLTGPIGTSGYNPPADTSVWYENNNYTTYDDLLLDVGLTADQIKAYRKEYNAGPKFFKKADKEKWDANNASYPYTGRDKTLTYATAIGTQRTGDYVKANSGPADYTY